MPVTNLVAYLWISSRWLISATRFVEQVDIAQSKCGRTKAPYKGMRGNFERSWEERFNIKINRHALFAASVHWAGGENIISVWTPRPLTNLDTGMGVPDPSRKKTIARELLVLICMSYYFDKPHVVVRDLSLPAELPFWRQKNSLHFWGVREVIQEKENQQWAYHRAFRYSIDSNLTENHLWHFGYSKGWRRYRDRIFLKRKERQLYTFSILRVRKKMINSLDFRLQQDLASFFYINLKEMTERKRNL